MGLRKRYEGPPGGLRVASGSPLSPRDGRLRINRTLVPESTNYHYVASSSGSFLLRQCILFGLFFLFWFSYSRKTVCYSCSILVVRTWHILHRSGYMVFLFGAVACVHASCIMSWQYPGIVIGLCGLLGVFAGRTAAFRVFLIFHVFFLRLTYICSYKYDVRCQVHIFCFMYD